MTRKKHIDEPVLTVTELAQRWKTSRHTITALINGGKLQAFKPGERGWRLRLDEVIRYETQHMGADAHV